jgi:formate/nitrite transporter FocA (FNT family)
MATKPTAKKPPAKHAGSTVDLSPREERDVVERSPPRAAVVFETIRREGENELERAIVSLFASGLAAGLAMGMSLAGVGMISSMLPDAPWKPLATSAGYTLGFLIVVLGRQQLFTENTLTAILPLLDNPDKLGTLARVGRLWAVVLVANLLGATIFAFAAAHTPIFSEAARAAFAHVGHEAAAPPFGTIVLRGIVAGWLIALMVWLLPGADELRLFVILIITYAVGLGSFSHIIAGSVEVLYLVAIGDVSWLDYFGGYLLPVFIGNVLGGVSLVAVLNYAQVVAD